MTNISTHNQALMQTSYLKSSQGRMSELLYQLNTGKKTDKFAGLGTQVVASERARANFNKVDTYINNMTIADRRVKMQINAIDGVLKQAGDVVNAIQIQTQKGEFEIESLGDLAQKARDVVISMINQQDGDRYLFSGADSHTRPIVDTGIQGTYMKAQINEWINGNISTDDLIAAYQDPAQLTDTITGYSSTLSSNNAGKTTVRVSENVELDYTVLGNNSGFRDILTGIAMLENLSASMDKVMLDPDKDPAGTITAPGADKHEQSENFYNVFNDIAVTINRGMDKLETETFKLSSTAARMSQMTDNYKLEKNTLTGIISDIENVDENEVAVKILGLQSQLEASYRVTAALSKLSLAYVL